MIVSIQPTGKIDMLTTCLLLIQECIAVIMVIVVYKNIVNFYEFFSVHKSIVLLFLFLLIYFGEHRSQLRACSNNWVFKMLPSHVIRAWPSNEKQRI